MEDGADGIDFCTLGMFIIGTANANLISCTCIAGQC